MPNGLMRRLSERPCSKGSARISDGWLTHSACGVVHGFWMRRGARSAAFGTNFVGLGALIGPLACSLLLNSEVGFRMNFQEVLQHHHQFATVPVTAACRISSRITSRVAAARRLFQQVSCHCCGGDFVHVLMFSDGHNLLSGQPRRRCSWFLLRLPPRRGPGRRCEAVPGPEAAGLEVRNHRHATPKRRRAALADEKNPAEKAGFKWVRRDVLSA